MITLSIRVPESLHDRVKHLASEDKVTINQFITSALAEEMSDMETGRYSEERGKRGDVDKFRDVLSEIPDAEPDAFDEIE